MFPAETSYQLLQSDDKKTAQACFRLARKLKIDCENLDFPTVIARRKGKLIGFLSTIPTKKAIIAGPMVVNLPHPGPVIIRLVEAYERILSMAGVTSYLFWVTDLDWSGIISRAFGLQPYHQDAEGRWWYQRHIDGRRQNSPDTGAKPH